MTLFKKDQQCAQQKYIYNQKDKAVSLIVRIHLLKMLISRPFLHNFTQYQHQNIHLFDSSINNKNTIINYHMKRSSTP